MERIRGFVENMFFGLPDSPELQRAKAQLIQGLADRYEEQLAQGRSEAEAFGIVAGEFGSMDELLAELGVPQMQPQPPVAPEPCPEPYPEVSREEYRDFLRWYPVANAMAVALCILSVAVWLLLRDAGRVRHIAMLLMVAAAVWTFVYLDQKRKLFMGPQGGFSEISPQRRRINGIQYAMGILAVVVYQLLGFVWNLWHPGWLVFLVYAALCKLVEILCSREEQ